MTPILGFVLLLACSSAHRDAPQTAPTAAPVATGNYPIYGRAPDNAWLAGKVERTLTCVFLRFADQRNAPWHGRMALAATTGQDALLHDGDAVIVHGEISALGYGACGAPSYRVSAVEEH